MSRRVRGTLQLPSSYTDPEIAGAQSAGRSRLWSVGSDSTGQLVKVRGSGTNASPYEGFVFGWCGGTGAAIATYNQMRIRIPRSHFNWMRVTNIRLDVVAGMGCDFTPLAGISDGVNNTVAMPLGEAKIATSALDDMVWECDALFRIDTGLVNTDPESMSNLLPMTGTDPHPCISIWTAAFAAVPSLAFVFVMQLEWVEL